MSIHSATVVLLMVNVSLATGAPKPGDPVPLTLSPAAAPTPSLKYHLLPGENELSTGNAATLYYRSFALLLDNQQLLKELRSEDWTSWVNMAPERLPRKEVRAKVHDVRNLLREIHLAARLKSCDWQIDNRPEGIGLLLPDLQNYRAIAQLLAVKARLEIAEKHFERALETLQTGLAMGKHISQGPTLIHVLVGASITSMMLAQLELFMEQPGAPNLYWAIAVLPRPFLDARAAMWQEKTMMERSVPGLRLLEKGPATPNQVAEVLKEIDRFAEEFQMRKPDLHRLGQMAMMLREYPDARRYLLSHDFTAAQIEAMPMPQAVIVFAFGQYRSSWDEMAKWSHVPDGFRHSGSRKAATVYREAVNRLDRLFFFGLLSGLSNGDNPNNPIRSVFDVLGRLDCRLAALQTVEAIRIYMAAHGGQLPKALADLTDVPAAANPVTGKPFLYSLEHGKVRLAAPVVPGEVTKSGMTYELSPSK